MITVPEALEAAADKIEEDGWVRGMFGSRAEGGFCLAGALHQVTDWGPAAQILEIPGQLGEHFALAQVYADATSFLRDQLAARGETRSAPTSWNDRPERTKEEVVAFLRECARSYREADDDRAA